MLHSRHTKKRWFTVHVHAHPKVTQVLVQQLQEAYELVGQSDRRRRFQTFDIYIAPACFRKLQNKLPRTITIAYEPKESKT